MRAERRRTFFAAVDVHYMEMMARQIQAEIMFARGDAARAVTESERALAFARNAKDPQGLYPSLAVHAWLLALGGPHAGGERAGRRAHASS